MKVNGCEIKDFANLRDANLRDANLCGADLYGANLRDANLSRTDLREADLSRTDLRGANLCEANLCGADLYGADLYGANLYGANLLCFGNMEEVKTLQIDTWNVGYTYDTLQIGCQRHPIEKWRKWDTQAGRKWINGMDREALEWADKHLDLILKIIEVSPAQPTGKES
jgi:hypothetical protein